MAYIVMACIVMAYTVMAYIVMAYMVMAYIVLAFTVMACTGMAYMVMACIVMADIVIADIVVACIAMTSLWLWLLRLHAPLDKHSQGKRRHRRSLRMLMNFPYMAVTSLGAGLIGLVLHMTASPSAFGFGLFVFTPSTEPQACG